MAFCDGAGKGGEETEEEGEEGEDVEEVVVDGCDEMNRYGQGLDTK